MTDKSYTNWISMSDKALAEQIGVYMKHHADDIGNFCFSFHNKNCSISC